MVDLGLLALASHMLAFTALNRGHLAEAETHSDQATEHERRAGHIHRALGFLSSGSLLKALGATRASVGLRWCEAQMPEIEGHPFAEARVTAAAAAFSAMLGDATSARLMVASSRSLFDEMAIGVTSEGVTRMLWAEVRRLDGDLLGAEQEYRSQCAALEATGERFQMATVAALLALVLADLGRCDEAERYVAMSQRATAHDDVQAQGQWRLARAKLCALSGRAPDAVTLAHEAVELIRHTEFLYFHADAVMGLADVLLVVVGRRVEAVPVFEEAVRLHERKGNLVRAGQARSALADLRNSSVP